VWVGVEVFRAGDRLVGVEYDSETTAAALRARCRAWALPADEAEATDVPAAFGVRVAKVGLRRRKVGVVHHGAPVRYRLPSPEQAVDVVARILDDIARERPAGTVSVDARCFVHDGRAVLVAVPLSRDVDERPLRAAGFAEVPAWRPVVDPAGRTARVGDEVWPLAGMAVVGLPLPGLDTARKHVWHLGEGDVLAWAELVDGLGDRLVSNQDDVLEACRAVVG
jgi:hypothetical protein